MATINPPITPHAADGKSPIATPSFSMVSHASLSKEWRRLTRVATFICVLTSPSLFLWFHHHNHWKIGPSILATFGAVVAFRGVLDILTRRWIPWPSLFGTDDAELKQEDITNRRRVWTWKFWIKVVRFLLVFTTLVWFFRYLQNSDTGWFGSASFMYHHVSHALSSSTFWLQLFIFGGFMIMNFLLFLGPMLGMGISQIRGYEPGDAEWGVKLDHVRGQAEAKEEVRRVVTLWQSGEMFEASGGKRERGLLFLGPPGTGKTMLAKAIATGFNSPFVTIPGSGFAQTFIGIDAIIVRYLARKAKKLARKWGGQCIVFIDEIDAVGMRRSSLAGSPTYEPPPQEFHGPWGAMNMGGDLIHETKAWRDWMFEQRAPERINPYPGWMQRVGNAINQGMFPGMMGGQGQLALQQLLVVMDGIDNPPFWRRFWTNRFNTLLDAVYVVPYRVGRLLGGLIGLLMVLAGLAGLVAFTRLIVIGSHWTAEPFLVVLVVLSAVVGLFGYGVLADARKKGSALLRLRRAKPNTAQIYFIGATNVPLRNLDPALIRPGRMGRHVYFRTPTKDDRKDIFDLYIDKVAHDPDLDTPARRDELARITSGYSPAMIDQICSMALTNAHHDGRPVFNYQDLVEAMVVVESGTAINVKYNDDDARAVAIHEAGHAAAAHVYRPELESSRLSIRMRGGSLGHHQFFDKEERFGSFQSTEFAELIHLVGSMAAEFVFYGENSIGVFGDLGTATSTAAMMVGASGMSPLPMSLDGKKFPEDETEDESIDRVLRRFEDIGLRLMNRIRSEGMQGDPIAAALQDPRKRMYAAQFLGQAFVWAYNLMIHNKDKVEQIANEVLEKKEIYGDDLMRMLDDQNLEKPEIDYTDENTWPKIVKWSKLEPGPQGPGGERRPGLAA